MLQGAFSGSKVPHLLRIHYSDNRQQEQQMHESLFTDVVKSFLCFQNCVSELCIDR